MTHHELAGPTRRTFLATALGAGAIITAAGPSHAFTLLSSATVVRASDFGYDAVDSTEYLQAALDSDAQVVIIDKVDQGDWITRPLFVNRDNLTVIFEPGVTLRAKPGGFPSTTDSLITVANRSDVRLLGYGAKLRMNKSEYTAGEWRHALNLLSAHRVTVEGLVLRDTGGDGIYVGVNRDANRDLLPGSLPYCRDITIRNVICNNNRRNALSVISVDGLVVEGSDFLLSNGTSPQAGVDFEPNWPSERLKRIVMRDCRFLNNRKVGLLVAPARLDQTSSPIDILFERIYIGRSPSSEPCFTFNGAGGFDGSGGDPGGQVTFRDSLIHKHPIAGAIGIFRKAAKGTKLTFLRTVIWDYETEFRRWGPITVSPARPAPAWGAVPTEYGGVHWHQCLLITDTTGPYLSVDLVPDSSPGLARLHGSLTVVNPNGVSWDLGHSPRLVTLRTEEVTAYSETPVTISVDRDRVQPGEVATITISRDTSDLGAPLAVRYNSNAGSAEARIDFMGLSESAVIRAGERSVRVPLRTRESEGSPSPRVARIALFSGVGYTVPGTRTVEVEIARSRSRD